MPFGRATSANCFGIQLRASQFMRGLISCRLLFFFFFFCSVDRDNCSNGHQVVGYTVFVDGQTEALVEGVDICTVELLELPNKTVHITVR